MTAHPYFIRWNNSWQVPKQPFTCEKHHAHHMTGVQLNSPSKFVGPLQINRQVCPYLSPRHNPHARRLHLRGFRPDHPNDLDQTGHP